MANARHSQRDEVLYRRYDDDGRTVIVADFGSAVDDASVEVVDGTAIVVIDGRDGSRQYEFDVPAGTATTLIRNGVLTIEVEST